LVEYTDGSKTVKFGDHDHQLFELVNRLNRF